MENNKVDVLNIKGEKVATIELDSSVFNGEVKEKLLYYVASAYLTNKRKSVSSTKTRGAVRGGGTKPWRQKGTGRARAGSIRSPLWRGGGVTFGPQPKKYYIKLPQQMKRVALKSSLNAKLKDRELVFLDKLEIAQPKTKEFQQILRNLKLDKIKSLFILDKVPEEVKLSCRNIRDIFVQNSSSVSAYEILSYKMILITEAALAETVQRLKKK